MRPGRHPTAVLPPHLAHLTVQAIASSAGFTRATPSALSALASLLDVYLSALASRALALAHRARRTRPSVLDCLTALDPCLDTEVVPGPPARPKTWAELEHWSEQFIYNNVETAHPALSALARQSLHRPFPSLPPPSPFLPSSFFLNIEAGTTRDGRDEEDPDERRLAQFRFVSAAEMDDIDRSWLDADQLRRSDEFNPTTTTTTSLHVPSPIPSPPDPLPTVESTAPNEPDGFLPPFPSLLITILPSSSSSSVPVPSTAKEPQALDSSLQIEQTSTQLLTPDTAHDDPTTSITQQLQPPAPPPASDESEDESATSMQLLQTAIQKLSRANPTPTLQMRSVARHNLVHALAAVTATRYTSSDSLFGNISLPASLVPTAPSGSTWFGAHERITPELPVAGVHQTMAAIHPSSAYLHSPLPALLRAYEPNSHMSSFIRRHLRLEPPTVERDRYFDEREVGKGSTAGRWCATWDWRRKDASHPISRKRRRCESEVGAETERPELPKRISLTVSEPNISGT